MALLRLAMCDRNGNVLPFFHGAVTLEAEGPIGIAGPRAATLRGGLGGVLVRTTGRSGSAALTLKTDQTAPVRVEFTVEAGAKREL